MPKRLKFAFVLSALVAIAALAWRPLQRTHALSAVEAASAPDCLITVGFQRDALLNHRLTRKLLGPWGGANYFREFRPRFGALVGGAIDTLHLQRPGPLREDLAGALAHFPALCDFRVWEDFDAPPFLSKAEWRRVCATVAACSQLETLHATGHEMSDDAFAAFAGHEKLRSVTLERGRFTPACMQSLGTLPQLKALEFSCQDPPTKQEWFQYCAGVRKLVHLEYVSLQGDNLTDAALALLAGHPKLKIITLDSLDLTPRSVTTFATLPCLVKLNLGFRSPLFSEEERDAMRATLPAVKIQTVQ